MDIVTAGRHESALGAWTLALRAIAATDAGLGEIALSAGDDDRAQLTDEFRIHAGMTPRASRRALRYSGGTSSIAGAEHDFQDGRAGVE